MICSVGETYAVLARDHYLGPTKAATFAWSDEFGVIVFAAPRARRIPHRWLEVVRWCLAGQPNGGSRQWAAAVAEIRRLRPDCTTVISYSDPDQGHTGALYRACNWLWAPTWLRLRPPPTGNGSWTAGRKQSVKDRWIYPLQFDPERQGVLTVQDATLQRKMPWAGYAEPIWRRGRFDARDRCGAYRRFCAMGAAT